MIFNVLKTKAEKSYPSLGRTPACATPRNVSFYGRGGERRTRGLPGKPGRTNRSNPGFHCRFCVSRWQRDSNPHPSDETGLCPAVGLCHRIRFGAKSKNLHEKRANKGRARAGHWPSAGFEPAHPGLVTQDSTSGLRSIAHKSVSPVLLHGAAAKWRGRKPGKFDARTWWLPCPKTAAPRGRSNQQACVWSSRRRDWPICRSVRFRQLRRTSLPNLCGKCWAVRTILLMIEVCD